MRTSIVILSVLILSHLILFVVLAYLALVTRIERPEMRAACQKKEGHFVEGIFANVCQVEADHVTQ